MGGWRVVYAYKLDMGRARMKRKTVMITGSSKGLGKSLAIAFAHGGYDMIIHGRDEERLKKVKTAITKIGNNCRCVLGDITSGKTVAMLYAVALENRLDILINNAAVYDAAPFGLMSAERTRSLIDTNLIAPIILSNRLLHIFIQNKKGLIININSIAGKQPDEKEAVYCATKCGLRSFSKSIRYKAMRHNVGVIDIFLGAMKTDMVKDRPDYDKFIDPDEAAYFIFNLVQNYRSLRLKEVEIGRANY